MIEQSTLFPGATVAMVLGDPLLRALDAVLVYHGGMRAHHEGDRDWLIESALTARAHVGPKFFFEGRERMLQFSTNTTERNRQPDEILSTVLEGLREAEKATKTHFWSLLYQEVGHVQAFAAQQTDKVAAWAFRRALADETYWLEIQAIAGNRGRGLHPQVLAHWKGVYATLGTILRLEDMAGFDQYLLRPQERDHWKHMKERGTSPMRAAAYFVWDRASRRGSFTTFIQHMGNRIDAKVSAALTPITEDVRDIKDDSRAIKRLLQDLMLSLAQRPL